MRAETRHRETFALFRVWVDCSVRDSVIRMDDPFFSARSVKLRPVVGMGLVKADTGRLHSGSLKQVLNSRLAMLRTHWEKSR
jgi:hypothetical protein